MKLFEATWTTKGKNYIRFFDGNKTIKTSTSFKPEHFIEDKLGDYTSFLDNVKLRKIKQNSSGTVYGQRQAIYIAIREAGQKFNDNPNIWYLDIETSVGTQPNSEGFPKPEEALEPIVLIQFFDTKTNKAYILGLEEWTYQKDYNYDIDVEYIKYDNEEKMILGFLSFFKNLDPLIITAWNGNGFDYPYIYNRFKKYNLHNKLSNYGTAKLVSNSLDNGQILNVLTSQGHYFLDLLDVYKKFIYKNVSSYSLDNIGEIETGTAKVEHLNYLKFDDFRTGKYVILGTESEKQKNTKIHKCAVMIEKLESQESQESQAIQKLKKYIKEKSHSEFIHYGVQDVILLKGINESQNLISIMVSIAEKMGCTIQDTLGTLKPWNNYISNILYKNKSIMPPKTSHENPHIVGGYVREPIKGKHNWIVSTDITSMYPRLSIAAFNMSPEKITNKVDNILKKYFNSQNEDLMFDIEDWDLIHNELVKNKTSVGINGIAFDCSKTGLIPKLVNGIFDERKQLKKKMFMHKQKRVEYEQEMKKRGLM